MVVCGHEEKALLQSILVTISQKTQTEATWPPLTQTETTSPLPQSIGYRREAITDPKTGISIAPLVGAELH